MRVLAAFALVGLFAGCVSTQPTSSTMTGGKPALDSVVSVACSGHVSSWSLTSSPSAEITKADLTARDVKTGEPVNLTFSGPSGDDLVAGSVLQFAGPTVTCGDGHDPIMLSWRGIDFATF
jgi:hypothetical protein